MNVDSELTPRSAPSGVDLVEIEPGEWVVPSEQMQEDAAYSDASEPHASKVRSKLKAWSFNFTLNVFSWFKTGVHMQRKTEEHK